MRRVTDKTVRRALRQWAAGVIAVAGFGAGSALAECGGSGFGGTGHAEPGSGFGGTGHACEGEIVGVSGVITGFGSIFVAGQEIHYEDDFPLDTPTGPTGTHALGLGQRVAVRARVHEGRLQAQHIALAPTLVGPVQATDADTLRVAGQTVRVVASTQRVHWPSDALAREQWLTVHGLRAPDGAIVATRVVVRPPAAAVYVEGVADTLTDGTVHIGGLPVRLPAGVVLKTDDAPQVFTGVLAADGVLHVQAVHPAPVTQLLETLPSGARVISENFLPQPADGRMPARLYGRAVALEPGALLPSGPPAGNGYAWITAQLIGGVLHTLALDTRPAGAWPGLVNSPGALLGPPLASPWPVLAPPIEYPHAPGLPTPALPERSVPAPLWPGSGAWTPNGRLGR